MAFPSQLIRRFLNEAARQPGLTFAEWLQGRTTGVFLGASVAVTDCGGDTSRDPGQAAEGACTTGDCASERGDGIVNAEDGAFDCADDGCVEQSPCLDVPVHGVPYEADCGDGADEDGDGATDCNDTECDADPAFVTGSLYRAPAGGDGGRYRRQRHRFRRRSARRRRNWRRAEQGRLRLRDWRPRSERRRVTPSA